MKTTYNYTNEQFVSDIGRRYERFATRTAIYDAIAVSTVLFLMALFTIIL
jgi:hypothetical protein